MTVEKVPGKLVVLEGIDGSGKTELAKRLSSRGFVWLPSPSWETQIGKQIRSILAGDAPSPGPLPLQLMFAVDRYEMCQTVLMPRLRAGAKIICDRWWYSSFAYGAVDEISVHLVQKIYRDLPVFPDLLLFLDVEPETGIARSGRRARPDMYDGDLAKQTKISETYKRFLEQFFYEEWHHSRSDEDWAMYGPELEKQHRPPVFLDANKSVETVLQEGLAEIYAMLAWTPPSPPAKEPEVNSQGGSA